MIACKEDLINTYIEKGNPALTRMYLDACEPHIDVHLCRVDRYPEDSHFYFNPSVKHLQSGDCDTECYKKLTLSDLKPRTKIVYEKVEFNHAWELVKQFELHNDIFYKSSSTTTYELMSIENIQNMLSNEYPVSLYRKVEKEIGWREEVHSKFQLSGYHWSTSIGEVINDESDCFLDLCRVALRATGELE